MNIISFNKSTKNISYHLRYSKKERDGTGHGIVPTLILRERGEHRMERKKPATFLSEEKEEGVE